MMNWFGRKSASRTENEDANEQNSEGAKAEANATTTPKIVITESPAERAPPGPSPEIGIGIGVESLLFRIQSSSEALTQADNLKPKYITGIEPIPLVKKLEYRDFLSTISTDDQVNPRNDVFQPHDKVNDKNGVQIIEKPSPITSRSDDGTLPPFRRTSIETSLLERGYKLGKLLGEGAYAKVYLTEFRYKVFKEASEEEEATFHYKTHLLACKVIDQSHASKNFLVKFLPREISMLLKVNHHHVVRIHSILKISRKYFLFLYYCEHGDLLQFMGRHGAIKEEQSKIWFAQTLEGLEYLHDNFIAHRDIKLENILVDGNFNVKISDFGFARIFLPGDEKSITFCGSAVYAPPEVIHGDPYDPMMGDVWSVGIMLFIMLNKSMPFDDVSNRKMYDAQMHRAWKFRHQADEILSAEVKDFVFLILEPVEKKRKTVSQLRKDLWFTVTPSTTGAGGRRQSLAFDPSRRRSTVPRVSPLYAY